VTVIRSATWSPRLDPPDRPLSFNIQRTPKSLQVESLNTVRRHWPGCARLVTRRGARPGRFWRALTGFLHGSALMFSYEFEPRPLSDYDRIGP
jgi:hypothetical protein